MISQSWDPVGRRKIGGVVSGYGRCLRDREISPNIGTDGDRDDRRYRPSRRKRKIKKEEKDWIYTQAGEAL